MICKRVYSCQESYIGEPVRNIKVRSQEHEDRQKASESTKHLKNNPTNLFTWKVLLLASLNTCIRKNAESSIMTLKRPSPHERVESKKLSLFRNSAT